MGLFGDLSAGKTALIRALVHTESRWQSFFVSTDQDTTAPIVEVQFGPEDDPCLGVDLLSEGEFRTLWAQVNGNSPTANSRALEAWIIGGIRQLRGSVTIDCSAFSPEQITQLAWLTVVKDYRQFGLTFPALHPQVLKGLPDVDPPDSALLPEAIRALATQFGPAYLKKILYVIAGKKVRVSARCALAGIGVPFLVNDVPGARRSKVDSMGDLAKWQALRNVHFVPGIAKRDFDIVLLCCGAKAEAQLSAALPLLCPLEADWPSEWHRKRLVIAHTLLDFAFRPWLHAEVGNEFCQNTPAELSRLIYRLPRRYEPKENEEAADPWIARLLQADTLDYESVPIQAPQFLSSGGGGSLSTFREWVSTARKHRDAAKVGGFVRDTLVNLAQRGRLGANGYSDQLVKMFEAAVRGEDNWPPVQHEYLRAMVDLISGLVRERAISAALDRIGLKDPAAVARAAQQFDLRAARQTTQAPTPEQVAGRLRSALSASKRLINGEGQFDETCDAWRAFWEKSQDAEADATALGAWLDSLESERAKIEAAATSLKALSLAHWGQA